MSSSERQKASPIEIVTTSGVKVVVQPTPPPAPVAPREPPPVERAPRVVIRPPPDPHAARDAAVRRIYEKEGLFLLRLLSRARINPASAEELHQEVLLVLTKYIDDRGAPPENDRGYLTEVAWRLLSTHQRATDRRLRRVDVAPEADADEALDSAPDPEELLQLVRDRVALEEAIDALPAVLQPVVRCVVLDDATIDEAAARLGRPRGTVSTQLTRGRALCAELLRALEGSQR
jgi:RNA polymerase sigma factor (sigma-70 family)